MEISEIAKVIEGVLFVSGEGVDIDAFKTKYEMNDREFNKCLDLLQEKYNENSGINLIRFKNKVQFCSNPAIADSITDILNPIRERSLTKTALETVAIDTLDISAIWLIVVFFSITCPPCMDCVFYYNKKTMECKGKNLMGCNFTLKSVKFLLTNFKNRGK